MSYDPLEVRYYTIAEVAGLLRLSKMTVLRAYHAGDLPGVRVGRAIRIPEPSLRAWLGEELGGPLEAYRAQRKAQGLDPYG